MSTDNATTLFPHVECYRSGVLSSKDNVAEGAMPFEWDVPGNPARNFEAMMGGLISGRFAIMVVE